MSLSNIVRKEIRELLTVTSVLPVVIMAIIFGSMGSMTGGIQEEISQPPTIGIVDQDNGLLSTVAVSVLQSGSTVVYNGSDIDEGIDVVREKNGEALLVITTGFTDDIMNNESGVVDVYWMMKGTGVLDSISSGTVTALMGAMSQAISQVMIEQGSTLNATIVMNPTNMTEITFIKDKELDGISPGTIGGILSSQSFIMPFLIMLIIMMSGGTVISSMALEKENKTLETLLTLPVKRGSIVTGKIVGSAIVGLIFAGIYMIGFSYYMNSLVSSTHIDLAAYGLALSPMDYLLLGISVFVTILAALALCMVMGAFAKNYKSIQTLTMPLVLLAMIPFFVTMFKDFDTLPAIAQVLLFAIPFSHPMMATNNLMFGDYTMVVAGIAYTAVFAIICIVVAVRIFNSDILLTGFKRKKIRERRGRYRGLLGLIRR